MSPATTPDPNPSVPVGLGTVSLWWTPAAPAGPLIVGTTGSTAVQTGSNVGILDLSVLTANPIAINPGSFAPVSGTLAGLTIGNGNGAFAVRGLMFGQIGQTFSSSVLLGEASVPEPGSGALLVLSALAFLGKRRNTVQF